MTTKVYTTKKITAKLLEEKLKKGTGAGGESGPGRQIR